MLINQARINSKEVKRNDIFFAIKGKKNDGNKFVKQSFEKKASIAVVNKLQKKINIPIINMPKVVFKFTKKNCKKNSKVGLLATEGTLKTGIYNKFFDKNYELLKPSQKLQKISVNKAIKLVKI